MKKDKIIFLWLCLVLVLSVGCATPGRRSEGESPPELSATEVYDRIGPSLAFVSTPLGSGSGALIDEGYILTNAHVVWPFRAVGVTFPDGTVLGEVPVARLDLIGDLALLGPVSVGIEPLDFSLREDLEIGGDVYLIGYPAESEANPKPTIARGILSRIREWERIRLTFFQTDAMAAGGQSGGVLVTDTGEVIGISSLVMAGESYALAASAKDIFERLETIASGSDAAESVSRELNVGELSENHEFMLDNWWATGAYVVTPESDTTIDLTARSKEDISLMVADQYGNILDSADEYEAGQTEKLHVAAQQELYYVFVEPLTHERSKVYLNSNQPLAAISDPDDGQELEVGHSYTGILDFPYDYDWYLIDLREGQRITVTVESVMIDPFINIDLHGVSTPLEDDDSGGGILGLNSSITFQATSAGKHLLAVSDADGYWTGGYIVEISEASADLVARTFGSETAGQDTESVVAEPEAPKPVDDPEAERQWKRYFGFLPQGWTADTEFFRNAMGSQVPLQFGGGLPTGYGYDPNVVVMSLPVPRNSKPELLVDQLIDEMRSQSAYLQVVSREDVTVRNIPGECIEMIIDNKPMTMRITQFLLLDENRMWILQVAASVAHEDYEVALDVIQSFQFPEGTDEGGKSFNTAMVASGFYTRIVDLHEAGDRENAEKQLELFARFAESIDRDDEIYALTMQSVGDLYQILGQYDKAIEYIEEAVSALDAGGQDKRLGPALNELAWTHYLSGRYMEGEPLGRRAVSICSEAYGTDHSSTTAASHTLAMLLVGLQQYEEAEDLLRSVLAVEERSRDSDDELIAGYLTDLLTALKRAGKDRAARVIEDRLSGIDTPPPDWATVGGVLPADKR